MNNQVKMNYKTIVKSIYKKALKEKTDVRVMIREWIMLFEASRVVGWDRMRFLDCCIEESDRLNYLEKYHSQEQGLNKRHSTPRSNEKPMYVGSPTSDTQQESSGTSSGEVNEVSSVVTSTHPADYIQKGGQNDK